MNKDLNSGTYSGTEVVHLTRRSCNKNVKKSLMGPILCIIDESLKSSVTLHN